MLYSLFRQLAQCFSWFVVIAPWEQAIRVRLGKTVTLLGAGWAVRIPFIDRVYRQSIRRRLALIRPQTLTTADRHVITLAGAVGFEVADLLRLYDTLEAPNDTIENEVAALVAKFIGARTLHECTSQALEEYVMVHLNLSRYGLAGQEFYTTSFATCKTYRFINGEFSTWSRDSGISMSHENSNQGGPPAFYS
jgi:hypothetical protein